MDMKKLALDTVRDIQLGQIGVAFDREMSRAVTDCDDRPALPKARTVAIVFTIAPELDNQGHLNRIAVAAQVHSQVPKQVSDVFYGVVKNVVGKHGDKQLGLMFRPDEPDEPTADKLYDRDVMERERREKNGPQAS